MGRPRLTKEQIENRIRFNEIYSALFKRIKKLFSNQEVKALLHHLQSQVISSYFVVNVSNLTNKLTDNKNIDPSDDEFKRKIIDYVLHPPINDKVQVIEVVNLEDDTGTFPKIEQEEMKIDQTPQVTEEMEYYENFELSPKK
jgi:hypothetical protein